MGHPGTLALLTSVKIPVWHNPNINCTLVPENKLLFPVSLHHSSVDYFFHFSPIFVKVIHSLLQSPDHFLFSQAINCKRSCTSPFRACNEPVHEGRRGQEFGCTSQAINFYTYNTYLLKHYYVDYRKLRGTWA